MRNRPFLTANEPTRAFGELLAERAASDPAARAIAATKTKIAELEGAAAVASDANERKRLQCEAEALRCAIDERRR